MQKYGFVYIWYDRKHRRFYIGSHWGSECDGYICSSSWMRDSYRRRPDDFRRRIIKRIYTTRKDLLQEEHRFLSMIKPSEIRVRYYNLRLVAAYWEPRYGKACAEETKKKISVAHKGKKCPESTRQKLIGRKHSEETKTKMRGRVVSDATRVKIGNATKNVQPGLDAACKAIRGKSYNEILGLENSIRKKKQLSEQLLANNPNKIMVECPHCGRIGSIGPMKRFHFDACKIKAKDGPCPDGEEPTVINRPNRARRLRGR